MTAFLKLIRYKNLLMILLTMVLTKYALLHSFIKNSYLSNLEFSILVLSVLLIAAGGYIVNDIFDIETDKINKPNNVFIGITISKNYAWKSYFLLTFFGLILGIYLSISSSLTWFSSIFIITSLGLFAYSKYLKKIAIVGNSLISIFVSLTIYLVYLYDFKCIEFEKLSHSEIENFALFFKIWVLTFFYSFFAFLTTLIREIVKDIEDVNGDLKIKAKTLPIAIGRKRASKVAFFFSCLLLFFLMIILRILISKTLFLIYVIIFTLLPLLYFLYKLWFAENKKDFLKLSILMKIIMFFGIVSMLLFKVN